MFNVRFLNLNLEVVDTFYLVWPDEMDHLVEIANSQSLHVVVLKFGKV